MLEGNTESNVDNLFSEVTNTQGSIGVEENSASTSGTETIESLRKQLKDTQAGFTKSRQEIAALKIAISELEKRVKIGNIEIPAEIRAELDALKHTDPELWRQKLNHIEDEARAKATKELKAETLKAVEENTRREMLREWNANNPDAVINEYVFNNVLPAGLSNKLRKGEIGFDAFLKEAGNYLRTAKVGPGNSSKAGKKDPMSEVKGLDIDLQKKDDLPDYKDCIF